MTGVDISNIVTNNLGAYMGIAVVSAVILFFGIALFFNTGKGKLDVTAISLAGLIFLSSMVVPSFMKVTETRNAIEALEEAYGVEIFGRDIPGTNRAPRRVTFSPADSTERIYEGLLVRIDGGTLALAVEISGTEYVEWDEEALATGSGAYSEY